MVTMVLKKSGKLILIIVIIQAFKITDLLILLKKYLRKKLVVYNCRTGRKFSNYGLIHKSVSLFFSDLTGSSKNGHLLGSFIF